MFPITVEHPSIKRARALIHPVPLPVSKILRPYLLNALMNINKMSWIQTNAATASALVLPNIKKHRQVLLKVERLV